MYIKNKCHLILHLIYAILIRSSNTSKNDFVAIRSGDVKKRRKHDRVSTILKDVDTFNVPSKTHVLLYYR